MNLTFAGEAVEEHIASSPEEDEHPEHLTYAVGSFKRNLKNEPRWRLFLRSESKTLRHSRDRGLLTVLTVEQQLSEARQRLLDLTMRNRLLNYRPSKARSVQVVNSIPREVYETLVIKCQVLWFRGRALARDGVGGSGSIAHEEDGRSLDTEEDDQTSRSSAAPSEEPPGASRPRHYLDTLFDSEALRDRLYRVNQEATSVFEEQGYSVLYLALGFLMWKESSDAVELRKAPLILIPVELERGKNGSFLKIRWTGGDIFPNVSLQAQLAEQGVILPGFEMADEKAEVDQFFAKVADAVTPIKDWSVAYDISLDFFSFTKFVMYKDLDPASWPEGMSPADNPLIREIVQPSGRPPSEGFREEELDERLKARDTFHIMDADPSQAGVIEDVKAGCNLVVEGPPGTGKSQTVANVIAQGLAAGKTVLFVSEKMAALEVVKSRLDAAGLGSFCLELHSRKANKKQMLQELQRSVVGQVTASSSSDEPYTRLDLVRDELNSYARALREPIGALGHSPFSLFSLKARSRKALPAQGEMPRLQLQRADEWSQNDWNEAVRRLRDFTDGLSVASIEKIRVWQGCDLESLFPADEEEIKTSLDICIGSLRELFAALQRLSALGGIRVIPTLSQLDETLEAADVLANSSVADRDVLLSDSWNQPNDEATALSRRLAACQAAQEKIATKFSATAFERESHLSAGLRTESTRLLRLFRPTYHRLRREVASLYRIPPPRRTDDLLAGLAEVAECNRLTAETRNEPSGKALFGSLWQNDRSDVTKLTDFAKWAVAFRRHVLTQTLGSETVEILCAGLSTAELREAAARTRKEIDLVGVQLDFLNGRLNPNYGAIVGRDLATADLTDIQALLELWVTAIPYLQRWSQLCARRRECLGTKAAPLVLELEERRVTPSAAQSCFESNYADDLLRRAFASRPALGQFVGELHERKIEHFADLDREVIRRNQGRLVRRLNELRPRIVGGASPGSEAGILLGEFNRKRGHMSIRKLLVQAGSLVQKVKPCFLMSPLSVAQFLDPRSARFDLIVFDEASQVRPEDALGALLRGGQVVVMGDTKQLPPTSFFDRIVEGDDGPDETSSPGAKVVDVESILQQCSRSFPSKTLRWHYRSRHESLIAVSNQEFYENQLLIYPSPVREAKELGLEFRYLPETVYDRGRSSVNREEARAVVRAAVEHYQKFPAKSLGIGAFNIKQQQAILDEVEIQLHKNPEMEAHFSSVRKEHFFVKNLETIQGDERDVIFLSIGFGFDANRRLSLNFGPLNQDGGERRLNVLITRARERCVVFSNFRASDLSLEPSSAFGLRALKVFLEYAETRLLREDEDSKEDTGSPFEDAVVDMLRSRGYEIRKQVGCAGFRVDLAVIDPKLPGRYLVGIECDGAKYHNTPVARDRDRLRQQILSNHGWQIVRVWSTDWYRNRRDTEDRLVSAIERARAVGDISARPATPLPSTLPAPSVLSTTTEGPAEEFAALMAPEYRRCESLGIMPRGDLHDQTALVLARGVVRVVQTEGPVHVEEVIRRVRSLWGLDRTGNRIRSALIRSIRGAIQLGEVTKRGDFLWARGQQDVSPRHRTIDPEARIDLICEEEIAAAVSLVLDSQFATPVEDLVIQTSRVFGIKATSSQTEASIRAVIDRLVSEKRLRLQPNGMLHRSDSP